MTQHIQAAYTVQHTAPTGGAQVHTQQRQHIGQSSCTQDSRQQAGTHRQQALKDCAAGILIRIAQQGFL